MRKEAVPLISIVVPVFNEAKSLPAFHGTLRFELTKQKDIKFEIIYCNDGSTDNSLEILHNIAVSEATVRVLSLSRNFGKESATTAGLQQAHGDAAIIIDADGQHPVELIGTLIDKWSSGHKVVVGLRTTNKTASIGRRIGAKLFYNIFGKILGMQLVPNATDFCLIDREVIKQFGRLTERNRITRGLINWLGYKVLYVQFDAKARIHGEASYSFRKLFKLAMDSALSSSTSPLYLSAFIGAVVLPVSFMLATLMVLNALFGDPLSWRATGAAYVTVLLLFLVGVLLLSQGIIGMYLARIHQETQNRPLYIIDEEESIRI